MEAPKIKYILTEQQLAKFCDMFGLDPVGVEGANAIGCLNTEYIRDLLIRADFNELKRGIRYIETIKKSYTYDELKKALARAYNTTPSNINTILMGKNNSALHFCSKCGKRISGRTSNRTGGICPECMVESLNL